MDQPIKDPVPIFVFSAPRSGSSLLMRYLHGTCPNFVGEVDGVWYPLYKVYSSPSQMRGEHPGAAKTLEEQIEAPDLYPSRFLPSEEGVKDGCRAIVEACCRYDRGKDSPPFFGCKEVYLGRKGGGTDVLDMLRDLYPDSVFVYLHRDPTACLTSMMGRWDHWWKGNYAECPVSAEQNINRQQRVLSQYPGMVPVLFRELVQDNFPDIFEERTGIRIDDSAFQRHRGLRIRH